MSLYEELPYDQALFGYKVANLTQTDISTYELQNVLAALQRQKVRLVYWTTSQSIEHIATAHKNNGLLVDEKITFVADIKNRYYTFDKNIHSVFKKPGTNALRSLALQSGIYSRFKKDSNFKSYEYVDLYTDWIKKSLSGEIAKDVLAYNEDGKSDGVITIAQSGNQASIGILAVDEHMRGKAIGTKLVTSAFSLIQGWGISLVQVSTQKENVAACTFYVKLGFKEEKIENVYHFWLL